MVRPTKEDMEEVEQKRIIKEAIKEWLDEQMAEFGWRSFWWLAACSVAAVLTIALWANGVHVRIS